MPARSQIAQDHEKQWHVKEIDDEDRECRPREREWKESGSDQSVKAIDEDYQEDSESHGNIQGLIPPAFAGIREGSVRVGWCQRVGVPRIGSRRSYRFPVYMQAVNRL